MDAREIVETCKQHTLYTWAATNSVNPMAIERAEGIYLYDADGNKIIDFNSQLMSVHIGHSHPRVIAAMKAQLDKLIYAFPGTATEPRAVLSKRLAELCPGDINTFFFTNAGAEANENAIRAARLMTGKQKILSRYRSYHGATNLTMQLTGDPRRWPSEPGTPGIIRVMDPVPYDYSFGTTDAERTEHNLQYLDEIIMYEGAQNIAAMIIESVTGTNGILPPPEGYLKGLSELLSRHGILLICDEVMAGFGRTGKMFGFEHGDIIPDMVCMAKGLTSSYIPLGALGMRDHVADYFRDNVFWGGLTYNSHPLALATATANLDVIVDEKLVENAATLQGVMRSEMDRLQDKHPSVKEGRCIGLFGMIDLQKNAAGERLAPYNGTSEAMTALGKAFRENHLFTFVRWGSFMCNPPLCITEEQLLEAFAIVDKCLDVTDAYFDG